jgi:hypothetical protein
MYPSDALRGLVALKVLDDPDRFDIRDVKVGSLPALWRPESRTRPLSTGRGGGVPDRRGPGVHHDHAVRRVVPAGRRGALRPGLRAGLAIPTAGQVDRQFGLDVAVRLIDPDELRQITRWALRAKSRVDCNMVLDGQSLWASAFANMPRSCSLTGKIDGGSAIDLTHIRRRGAHRNLRLSLECGTGSTSRWGPRARP